MSSHRCKPRAGTHLDLGAAQVLQQRLQGAQGGGLHEDAPVRQLDGLQGVIQSSLCLCLSTHMVKVSMHSTLIMSNDGSTRLAEV